MDELTPADQALANKILAHCKHMATLDREYALYAWKQYIEALPWLRLENIKKTQTDGNSVK